MQKWVLVVEKMLACGSKTDLDGSGTVEALVCSPVSYSLSLCLSILVTRLSLSRLFVGSESLGIALRGRQLQ